MDMIAPLKSLKMLLLSTILHFWWLGFVVLGSGLVICFWFCLGVGSRDLGVFGPVLNHIRFGYFPRMDGELGKEGRNQYQAWGFSFLGCPNCVVRWIAIFPAEILFWIWCVKHTLRVCLSFLSGKCNLLFKGEWFSFSKKKVISPNFFLWKVDLDPGCLQSHTRGEIHFIVESVSTNQAMETEIMVNIVFSLIFYRE